MSSEDSANPKLLQIYKRVLSDFKVVWSIKHHYEVLSYQLGDEDLMQPPFDLNRLYGTLKVLYEVIQKNSSPALINRLETVAHEIVATNEWFDQLDHHISPYDIRVYIEQNPDIDQSQLGSLARYFLGKNKETADDVSKADYMLARAFSWVDDQGIAHINLESEEKLEEAISKLLPRKWRKNQPVGSLGATAQLIYYTEQVRAISSYDQLVSSGVISEIRKFKNDLGESFYSAQVLSRCVQLNVELRNRFNYFYREENEQLKQFSLALLNSTAEIMQNPNNPMSQDGLFSAIEFSQRSSELLAADYNETQPYLEHLAKVRDMLQRTARIHGLDPYAISSPAVENIALALNERNLDNVETVDDTGLQERLSSLNEMIRSIQSAPRPSAVKILNLPHSTLVLSSWEFDAFKPASSDSYFTRLTYDVLKRSVALIAEIQENLALYKLHSDSFQLSNSYLMKLNFYVLQAQKIAEELEKESSSATDRQQIDAACNLSATRQKLLDSCNKIKPIVEKAISKI
ncbi:MAG: hypothetical protein FD167_1539 [bacterium]|nr:MAG: hypothetical protein FD167_1539 [bacterium]